MGESRSVMSDESSASEGEYLHLMQSQENTGFPVQDLQARQPALSHPPLQETSGEYCVAVWAPHTATAINKPERVHGFAARLTTSRWSCHGHDVVSDLGWPRLAIRRDYQKLCLCRHIISRESIIPPFPAHPSLTKSSSSRQEPRHPFCAYYHKASSFVSTASLWNSVPEHIATISGEVSSKNSPQDIPFLSSLLFSLFLSLSLSTC